MPQMLRTNIEFHCTCINQLQQVLHFFLIYHNRLRVSKGHPYWLCTLETILERAQPLTLCVMFTLGVIKRLMGYHFDKGTKRCIAVFISRYRLYSICTCPRLSNYWLIKDSLFFEQLALCQERLHSVRVPNEINRRPATIYNNWKGKWIHVWNVYIFFVHYFSYIIYPCRKTNTSLDMLYSVMAGIPTCVLSPKKWADDERMATQLHSPLTSRRYSLTSMYLASEQFANQWVVAFFHVST
jgi:hypothetical protein